ncbi:WASH complex subunit 3 [Lutzomyia longipalpis]|uniref:Putative wash complex subunit ccdc53 n=1 Tax=Lutzomyia longipalpis TaxID=7200 RepID=A0A1B0EZW2_LUTLO|nr:WASH complex subunit 3 [Lutzomyia longipalpis]
MDEGDLAVLGQQIDKSQVPPIHQKRILAFVNTFVVSTVTFLNKFVIKCESKFIEFETKLQKVEASLAILENKLASIPGIPGAVPDTEKVAEPPRQVVNEEHPEEVKEIEEVEPQQETVDAPEECVGVRACEDTRYRKYFKMVQFGVPPPAVKQKMNAEGLNPDILDDPNRILPDGVQYQEPVEFDD